MGRKLSSEEYQRHHNNGQKDRADGHDITSPRGPELLFSVFDQETSNEAWEAYNDGKWGSDD